MTVFVEDTERNKRVYEDRKAGMQYTAIGEKYGFSGERARQIVMREHRRYGKAKVKALGRGFTDTEYALWKKEIGRKW